MALYLLTVTGGLLPQLASSRASSCDILAAFGHEDIIGEEGWL